MRLNHALVVLLFTIPLTAQEEPLPVVAPRTAAPEVMLIATAVEPIRDFRGPTLAEAARANDFITFDALYREARQRGEQVAAFAPLHELWVYSVTSPIGAFYGTDLYEQLARAYPGYAQFIADYSIVDSHGNVFYPTAETREFVLARAIEGRTAQVAVAGDVLAPPTPARADSDRSNRSDRTDRLANAPVVATTQRAAGRAPRRTRSTVAPAESSSASQAPAANTAAQASVVATDLSAPVAGVDTAAPSVAEAAPIVEDIPQPAVAEQAAPAQPAVVETVPQPAAADTSTSRGIVLIVIGLIGIGLLAVMFRKETAGANVRQPAVPAADAQADEKPVAPVEPLKRPEGPQRAAEKNRANGLRG